MDYAVIKELTRRAPAPMALATIVEAKGSTPRHEGTNMLVFEDGGFVGTVGGGTGEERIRTAALEVLAQGTDRLVTITLNDDIALKEGMICGGTMRVWIEVVRDATLYREAIRRVDAGLRGMLLRDLSSGSVRLLDEAQTVEHLGEEGAKRLFGRQPVRLDGDSFHEAVRPHEKLVVFGAGHVSMPITEFASRLAFEVTVVDDREEFANRERFPWADRVVCRDFDQALDEIEVDDATYVVLVTRGHTWDTVCLRRVLPHQTRYIGMIGSKSRVGRLLDNLEAEGFLRADLDRVHTPIGLPIGAETPDEIAISILAEIVAVRRGVDPARLTR